MTDRRTFSVTWDYRCPFARNAHEHLVTALESGAPWDVTFVPFFLDVPHVPDGAPPAWEDPERSPNLQSLLAGIVVRDRFPEQFLAVHRSLFRARHDAGGDLRDRNVVTSALREGGVDPDAVWKEVEDGWPQRAARSEHENAVGELDVFGVPTFIMGDRAVFARLMTRPDGDAERARRAVELVLDLIEDHVELNEFKYTRIPR